MPHGWGGCSSGSSAVASGTPPVAIAPPQVQRLMDALAGSPSYTVTADWRIAGWNAAYAALYPGVATARGEAGYAQYRRDFARLIWETASPKWHFDAATFDRSAAAFDNPDYVAIVIHNYRWRLGLAPGEAKYDDLERRLAVAPVIGVPTITMEGDANGAPHPAPEAYRKQFSGKYRHRTVTGGIGHNLPQEAPEAFARAVIEVDRI